MNAGDYLRDVLLSFVAEPTVDQLLGDYTNQELAETAGVRRVTKRADPDGYKQYRTFMRALQRRRALGTGRQSRPGALRLQAVAGKWRIARLVEMIEEGGGLIVKSFHGKIKVVSPKAKRPGQQERERIIRVEVFLPSEDLEGYGFFDNLPREKWGDVAHAVAAVYWEQYTQDDPGHAVDIPDITQMEIEIP